MLSRSASVGYNAAAGLTVNTYPLETLATMTFVLLPALLVLLLVMGVAYAARKLGEPARVRRRVVAGTLAGAAVWMTGTWIAARAGLLLRWDSNPPPFVLLLACILLLSAVIAFSGYGRRLALGVPLWALVAVQGFRLPLELAMHALYERGIMPGQMSYSGRNFDIVTGVTALIVGAAVWRGRGGKTLVLVWNVLGLGLLVNVVTVAVLSTPRIRYFGDDQILLFVMYAPFVWLPAVMVLAALAGHLIIFRALGRSPGRRV